MLPDRIMQKISPEPNSGCWLWTASLNWRGYGQVRSNGPVRMAHRVVYEAYKGGIPDGLQLDHLCRVRSCVNPDHLEPVTPKENVRRGNFGHGGDRNLIKTRCPKGHPYEGDNLYVRRNGSRQCRACHREESKRHARSKRGQQLGH